MEKSQIVFVEVGKLYSASTTNMGKWMWQDHTQWVADKAKVLAKKYGADIEASYCAALIHDLGDSKYERGDNDFDTWTWQTGKEILRTAGFRRQARDEILEAMRTHSCHPNHLPTAIEGKVLATADGMRHIQTSFFPMICYMNRPEGIRTYEEWQSWFNNKIGRDYNAKILFKDEKDEVKEDYEALLRVFGNGILNDR